MKYCPKCKTRAAGDGNVCATCGGPLRTIGAPAAGELPAEGGEEQLALRLRGLQHDVGRSRRTMRMLGVAAAGLTVFFVLLLISTYVNAVRQYATISRVDVAPSDSSPGAAEISYTYRTSGKVEFIRQTAGRTETLVEHVQPDAASLADKTEADRKFVWGGGKSGDGVIRAKYRDGWSIATREWTVRR